MKKYLALFIVFLSITLSASAQSSQLVCTAYKQIFRFSGDWGKWPNHWTSYKSEGRSNPVIRVTTVSEDEYYRIQMFSEGSVMADFYVQYDPEASQQKRRDWNDEYVNCYRDPAGDYVYTQKVSLKSLASDPSAWANTQNAILYLWVFSEDMAVLVR
ncbi:MAG: hypothetical protein ACFB15_30760 [Cyclobacteriaceae bacterium]